MKENYFENEFAEFWIENGIMFFIYKRGVKVNQRVAERVVSDRIKLQNGVAYPVFCDMTGIKDSDKAGRDYLAKEGSALVTAVAALIDSPVTKIMLNFYLNINRPITPTRMFTVKSEALAFLESYKKQGVS